MSLREVGRRNAVSYAAVRRHRLNHLPAVSTAAVPVSAGGVPRSAARQPNIRKMRMRQLYAQGLSLKEIAYRFGVTHQRVSKIVAAGSNADVRRLHKARIALDKKLILCESVTLDDYLAEDGEG